MTGRRVNGCDLDALPFLTPGAAGIDARPTFPINVAETANAPLDMTAAVVEATPYFMRPARQAASDEFV
jgi:hypothetical protein